MCSQEKSAAAIFSTKIAVAFFIALRQSNERNEKHEEKHLQKEFIVSAFVVNYGSQHTAGKSIG